MDSSDFDSSVGLDSVGRAPNARPVHAEADIAASEPITARRVSHGWFVRPQKGTCLQRRMLKTRVQRKDRQVVEAAAAQGSNNSVCGEQNRCTEGRFDSRQCISWNYAILTFRVNPLQRIVSNGDDGRNP